MFRYLETISVFWVFLVLGCSNVSIPTATAPGVSASRARELDPSRVWKQFRESYPYLMQCVAVEQTGAGECVVIVSEPPTHVTEGDLRELLPGVVFKRHTIGYKGWVTDAVAHLQLSKEGELADLISELHRLLFDTSYKAFVIQLPVEPQLTRARPNLDLELAPDDLATWLGVANDPEQRLRLRPLFGGQPVTLADLDSPFSEVCHSEPAGLVGWWIPKDADLSLCRAQARHFAVDSDLILGAIENGRGVLIVGRERRVPYKLLPPLRAETILLLSTIDKDELMQSINPQVLSCYISSEPPERWELNFLSPELSDTEFGTLLSVADVLLKSWSLNGLNSVRGLRDYPTPKTWPFKRPLLSMLETSELVFNYDSEAAGRLIRTPNGPLCHSVVRTGVLPLAYLSDEQMEAGAMSAALVTAEQDGYDWFAKQCDPHLVRVVQYTALLQAFRAFGVTSVSAKGGVDDAVMEAQRAEVLALLSRVTDSSDADFNALVARAVESPHRKVVLNIMAAARKEGQLPEEEHTFLIAMLAPDEIEAGLRRVRESPADKIGKLARRFEEPQLLLPEERQALKDVDKDDILEQMRLYTLLKMSMYAPILASGERLDKRVADRLSDSHSGWIHSPVLIYDHNVGAIASAQGGHNLKTMLEKVRPSRNATRGKITKGRDGSWIVHKDDVRRVVLRGRGRKPVLLPRPPARLPMKKVLDLARQPFPKRGPLLGWRAGKRMTPNEQSLVKVVLAERPKAVVVMRRSDGTFLIHNGKRPFEARTYREAVDFLLDTTGGRKVVDLELAGLKPGEADALGTSLMTRRHALDRTVRVTIKLNEARPGLPTSFQLSEYLPKSAEVTSLRLSSGTVEGQLSLAATRGTKPVGRIGWHVRARNRALVSFQWNKGKVAKWFRESWKESKDLDQLRRNLEGRMRFELEKALPGQKFPDLKLHMHFPQKLQDRYITEGTRKQHGQSQRVAA